MKKDIHVVGAIIQENQEILCAQRGPTKSLSYKWEFPGGKIEQGESPEEALIREIDEELQCQVEVGDQIEHTVYEYDFGVVHLTTYFCELLEGTPMKTEHHALEWISKNKLNQLDWAPADIPAIEKLVSLDWVK